MPNKVNTASNLQGLIRLVADATIGVTDLVETVHHQVVHPSFLPSTPIQHLLTKVAGVTYNSIRWSTRVIGGGLDKLVGQLAPLLREIEASDEKEALRAVLNGVIGDYLEEKENPLHIAMQFRYQSNVLLLTKEGLEATYPVVSGQLLVLAHGLCMNDIQWTRKEHNHGAALAEDLCKTPVYLHYNSGRHISDNGQDFNALLEELVDNWPVPVEELVIVAHSMGGLVTRSALHYGEQEGKNWTKKLQKIVFLGTPHHGAPLEQVGNYIDVTLESLSYTKPFARLGKIRSAGITDLRYGNLVEEDWQGKDRFEPAEDQREVLPLPKHIDCYSVAAVIGKLTDCAAPNLLGDGLVSIKSAMGQQKDTSKNLFFEEAKTLVVYDNTHFDLLSNTDVYAKMKTWLEE